MLAKPFHTSKRKDRLLAFGLAVLVMLACLLLTDWRIHPYKLTLQHRITQSGYYSRIYDLDHNDSLDLVHFRRYGQFATLEVFKPENGRLLYLKRLKGEWPPRRAAHIQGDTDRDGLADLFCITMSNDSLFLNHLHHFDQGSCQMEVIFVDFTGDEVQGKDVNMPDGGILDLDSDGNLEVWFRVHAGYSKVPRKYYVYHPDEKRLISSEDMGATFSAGSFVDLDKDGYGELLTGSSSTENHDPGHGTAFGDHHAGLFAFNHLLELQSIPLIFREGKPYSFAFPLTAVLESNSVKPGVRVLCTVHHMDSDGSDTLHLLDASLKPIDRLPLPGKLYSRAEEFRVEGVSYVYLNSMGGRILRFVPEQPFIQIRGLRGRFMGNHGSAALFEGKQAFLLKGRHLILTDPLLRPVSNKLATTPSITAVDAVFDRGDGARIFSFPDDKQKTLLLIAVKPSALYPWRILFYGLLFFLMMLVFRFGSWLSEYLSRRRKVLEFRLQVSEMQAAYNQMQPHFIFNMLSAVGDSIYQEEKAQAYDYLTDASSMIRSILDNRNQSTWSMDEELRFIRLYIRLQNFRFGDKFMFQEDVDENLNLELAISRMIIHTFVENAVKHAFTDQDANCRIFLRIKQREEGLEVVVEDNGIGREAAREQSRPGSGNGIRLIREYIRRYNKLHGDHYALDIEDVVRDGGKPSGTRVKITLPILLIY